MRPMLSAIVCLLLIGCGPGPKQTFERARAAEAKRDFHGFASCLTPDKLDVMNARTCAMIVTVSMLSEDKQMRQDLLPLLEKHGLEILIQRGEQPGDSLFKRVKDKPRLYADMMTFMVEHRKKGTRLPRVRQTLGSLTELKTKGESAVGTVVVTRNGKESRNKIHFKKINGKWLIDPDLSIRPRSN